MGEFHYSKLESTFRNRNYENLKSLVIVIGKLYHQGNGGVLAHAFSSIVTKEDLH